MLPGHQESILAAQGVDQQQLALDAQLVVAGQPDVPVLLHQLDDPQRVVDIAAIRHRGDAYE